MKYSEYSKYLAVVNMYLLSPDLVLMMFSKQDIIRAHAIVLNHLYGRVTTNKEVDRPL